VARPKIVLNHAEWARLLESDQVRDTLRQVADGVADRARETAGVATGEYRDSIKVDDTTAAALGWRFRRGGNGRASEAVVAHAPHSLAVESRTGNLKRALGG